MTLAQSSNASPADLATCDKELIHIPGRIQPHGVLFVLAPGQWTIEQVSSNTRDLLGVDAESLIGRPLQDAIGASSARALSDRLTDEELTTDPLYLATVTAHSQDGSIRL